MHVAQTKSIFSTVIDLPKNSHIFDFSKGFDLLELEQHRWGIGKYNEKRPHGYDTPLFEGKRNIHMGVDLFAPIGTPVKSFFDGKIYLFGYNEQAGDYGYTVVTEHTLDGLTLYALYGHLNKSSIIDKGVGRPIRSGETLGWTGDRHENGGWSPHVHFQLSYHRPDKPDMPGVVSDEQLPFALLKYPDPRLVLGRLY